jgi:hypothetical protein
MPVHGQGSPCPSLTIARRKRPAQSDLPEKERFLGRGKGRPSNAEMFANQQRKGENPFQITLERSQGKTTPLPQSEDTMDDDL